MVSKSQIEAFFADLRTNGILPTVEKYYADNAMLAEAGQEAKVGKPAIVAAETYFANMLEKTGHFEAIEVHDIIIDGDKAVIEQTLSLKFKDSNDIVKQHQLDIQVWSNGKIVKETFWHEKH
eukprot:TRINITY_DN3223_c0_g2_i6.p2 TRINITY_DN3223_c0_g2~~TRINITY_DN3223_c0_g2_i6.p2  ORF type:complete len:122 (+),score=46.02 TRINITY_DN3223_c0_g2_i6:546-911(+)